jgi:hypothetical protein
MLSTASMGLILLIVDVTEVSLMAGLDLE